MANCPGSSYPKHRDQLWRLVQQHLELRDEPLLLAVYYAPERDLNDVFLFEVIENFGGNGTDVKHDLFEVTYGSVSAFTLEHDQRLHLVLTNLLEFRVAVQEGWAHIGELQKAFHGNQADILHQQADNDLLDELLEKIRE
ncbi:MAG: hypothetical protein KAV82_07805 [Phycisphaerae bacterium]|nr:hypothetical protein [Phycisphaerae bacterium]